MLRSLIASVRDTSLKILSRTSTLSSLKQVCIMVLPSSLWIFTIEKTFSWEIVVRMHSTRWFCWREAAQWRAVPNTLWDLSAASLSISGTALRRALRTFSSTSLVCRSLSRMNSSADFASYNTNKGNLVMVQLVQINYSNYRRHFQTS